MANILPDRWSITSNQSVPHGPIGPVPPNPRKHKGGLLWGTEQKVAVIWNFVICRTEAYFPIRAAVG